MADKLLTPEAVAERIGVTEKSLTNWRGAGTGPAFVRAGRLIRYREADVTAWIESRVTPMRS
jgi:predicted DNA-binding transcriptional regulator AlpA